LQLSIKGNSPKGKGKRGLIENDIIAMAPNQAIANDANLPENH
jgi:hypothetical protein